jgi:hypothetical protein
LRAALRGERGSQLNFWEHVYIGAIDADGSPASSGAIGTYQWLFLRPQIRDLQADLVEALTEAVEITKQDSATQWPTWKAWCEEYGQMRERSMAQAMVSLLASSIQRVVQANYRNQARLHTARVALAAERYRLANGKWPETLEQLTPRFLTEVPLDPFAPGRLRLRRTEEGLVIYSVGPNEQDDGGDLEAPSNQDLRDVGFRLWHQDRRRQPAAK